MIATFLPAMWLTCGHWALLNSGGHARTHCKPIVPFGGCLPLASMSVCMWQCCNVRVGYSWHGWITGNVEKLWDVCTNSKMVRVCRFAAISNMYWVQILDASFLALNTLSISPIVTSLLSQKTWTKIFRIKIYRKWIWHTDQSIINRKAEEMLSNIHLSPSYVYDPFNILYFDM